MVGNYGAKKLCKKLYYKKMWLCHLLQTFIISICIIFVTDILQLFLHLILNDFSSNGWDFFYEKNMLISYKMDVRGKNGWRIIDIDPSLLIKLITPVNTTNTDWIFSDKTWDRNCNSCHWWLTSSLDSFSLYWPSSDFSSTSILFLPWCWQNR